MKKEALTPEEVKQLTEFCAEFEHDPVGFVWAAFPWGEGELAGQEPQQWQLELLEDLAKGLKTVSQVIREAVASGNGIGKSALVAWIILWAISTHEDTRGIVTANTDTQLRTKTWAELAKWFRLFVANRLFEYTATSIYSIDPAHEKTWRIDAIPWSEQNPEAFAGLHNQRRRVLIIFDEASAIADTIWETVEGATTDKDTEIIWCAFGNPTRNTGRFFDCFHKQRNRWNCKQIDSRTVAISNKELLNEWIEDWGIDSDFVKVHVRGLFPDSGDLQLISRSLVDAAIERGKTINPETYKDLPIVFGVDPAWTGSDLLVCFMRQGNYSKVLFTMPKNDDDTLVAGKLARLSDEYGMDHGFIDQGFGTGIYSYLKSLGRESDWTLTSFANEPNDKYYLNKRAEIWDETRKWLKDGGALEDMPVIRDDLISPQAWINRKNKLQIESKEDMKKRGLPSPNYADALALTFTHPVQRKNRSKFRMARAAGKMRRAGAM
ncbi:hypothetical protein SAMN04487864_11541 [Succiniclasticum ruminis]|uniref:Terminase n=1 Tax=Succiniclasticum ruminis TaxID=40841 RepID=A0A1G6NQD7_9FIRM|nr:terminase [Succiniclasticum ruminis]SDC69891.1 hypothetical protein SAMN04487864_11541 [Succiniclasticum ruminis]